MIDLPRQRLGELISRHGRALCDEPPRLEALLRDHCGESRREINLLMAALKARVVARLIQAPADARGPALLAGLSRALEEEAGLTGPAARWAVESWAMALGLDSMLGARAASAAAETAFPSRLAEPVASPALPGPPEPGLNHSGQPLQVPGSTGDGIVGLSLALPREAVLLRARGLRVAGILTMSVGLVVSVMLYAAESDNGLWSVGLIPISIGLALLFSSFVVRRTAPREDDASRQPPTP